MLHGIHACRTDTLSRIELLWRAGFVVLAPDLQGHGESGGDHMTFGHLESKDAQACVAYLRTRFPQLRVGIIGISYAVASFPMLAESFTRGKMAQGEEQIYSAVRQIIVCDPN